MKSSGDIFFLQSRVWEAKHRVRQNQIFRAIRWAACFPDNLLLNDELVTKKLRTWQNRRPSEQPTGRVAIRTFRQWCSLRSAGFRSVCLIRSAVRSKPPRASVRTLVRPQKRGDAMSYELGVTSCDLWFCFSPSLEFHVLLWLAGGFGTPLYLQRAPFPTHCLWPPPLGPFSWNSSGPITPVVCLRYPLIKKTTMYKR